MNRRSVRILFAWAAIISAGCGENTELFTDDLAQEESSQNGLSLNGLSWNGLSWNGLSWNGLSWNGLSWNGLSWNGLAADSFRAWFLGQTAGPASSDLVMRYIVKCAAPAGAVLSATIGDVTYSWAGELGLAPQWTAGNPIPVLEQQLITACLAAHVNKFGLRVGISVLGYKSDGSPIPVAVKELETFKVKEGCFFGNLFSGEGIFVGNDSTWGPDRSSVRACAITEKQGVNNSCPPLAFAGVCSELCAKGAISNYYSSCRINNRAYASLNTRIADTQIYHCGDHICQTSESCGTGNTADNCKDCGPCQ